MHKHVCTMYVCVRAHACVHVCVCVCACVRACVRACVCIKTHTHIPLKSTVIYKYSVYHCTNVV